MATFGTSHMALLSLRCRTGVFFFSFFFHTKIISIYIFFFNYELQVLLTSVVRIVHIPLMRLLCIRKPICCSRFKSIRITRVASISSSSLTPCPSIKQISRAAATLERKIKREKEGRGRSNERPRQPANERDNSLSRLPSNRSAAGRRDPKSRTGRATGGCSTAVPILSRREHQSGRPSREGAWLSVLP